jgi:hypothetical protein
MLPRPMAIPTEPLGSFPRPPGWSAPAARADGTGTEVGSRAAERLRFEMIGGRG